MRNSSTGASDMGKFKIAPQFQDLPLLPYEKQLIGALDCTKEEYLNYRNAVLTAKYTRTKEYDIIPEIKCDVVTAIVVNLVVGILLTAVAASLQPKVSVPEAEEEDPQRNLKLQDKVGRQKFNQTQGIDVGQEVAKLGSTVPVLFGRYDYEQRIGGIFAPAQLVWSRMLSLGNEQLVKCLFVLGEAIDQDRTSLPNLSGIYLGQAVASGFTKEQIAVYWSKGRPSVTSTSVTEHEEWRPDNALLFGTRVSAQSADPSSTGTNNTDPFLCPVNTVEEAPGFSQIITPSNNSEFGAYGAIRNGNTFKASYEIIAMGPNDNDNNDKEDLVKDRRRKICGRKQEERGDGQAGIGRGYAPLMGLVELRKRNGREYRPDNADWDYQDLYDCEEGDELDFYINSKNPRRKGDADETFALNKDETDVEEMRGILERIREAADDALMIGQMIMIGRTIWQVTKRSAGNEGIYLMDQRDPEDDDDVVVSGNSVTVTLSFVETTTSPGATRIGLAGRAATKQPVNYEGGSDPEKNDKDIGFVPNFYFPLLKFKLATYRNTRPVDVTELGIESTVYNRANGLCNFKSLPSPDDLEEYDENNVIVREGRLSEYFERTSVFVIQGRPITSENDEPKEWEVFGDQFAITGKSPVKMFNYLRITHVERCQMEFRLVPKTAADIVTLGPEAEMMQLDASNGKLISTFSNSVYGNFNITTTGRYIRINDFFNNVEMQTRGAKAKTDTSSNATYSVNQSYLPTNQTRGRVAAFYREVFGDASSYPMGTVKQEWVGASDSRAEVLYQVRRSETTNAQYISQYGTNDVWQTVSFGQVRRGEGLSTGAVIDVKRRTSSSNIFARANGYAGQDAGFRMVVTQATTSSNNDGREAEGNRNFDKYSQIAEVSHFLDLSKSCDSQPEHRISYVNETLGNQDTPGIEDSVDYTKATYYEMQMLGLVMRSNNQLNSLNQVRVWLPHGAAVTRLAFDDQTGPSNLFPDLSYWLLTNETAGLGALADSTWIDKESFEVSAKYCNANRIFIDGALSDKVNVRQFLASQSSMNLVNFSIANGKLALVPALPFDSNTFEISATKPVTISHYFNVGNIIEGSYTASYTDVSERMPIRAVMIWRSAEIDSQARLDSQLIRYREEWPGDGPNDPAMSFVATPSRGTQQTFNLSEWVSNKRQAMMIGRYILAQRQRITHRINFKTTPYGLSIAPATYIEINVPEAPTLPRSIGVIAEDGSVLSDYEIPDGQSEVLMYRKGSDDVERVMMEYKDGRVTNEIYWGSVFSSLIPDSASNTYLIEEVTIDEDGLVDITASHFPTNSLGESLIAKDVLDFSEDNTGRFFYRD
jgi:hypothetical protein